MIKRIPIGELRTGMYVHDLNCSWRAAHLHRLRRKITGDGQVQTIRDLGVREVYIDTALGDDLAGAPTEDEVRRQLETEIGFIAARGEAPTHHRLASAEELAGALEVHDSASGLVRDLMTDVRLGRQLEFESISETLRKVTDGVMDNFGTLLQLGQLKNADDYTFQHCVGVCALLTAFGKGLELSRSMLFDLGVGALLHDIGKMKVPPEILNKPGALTKAEFDEMKQHVAYGRELVRDAPWVSPTALNVLEHHHERYDGTGYPHGLKGADISHVGQMTAIIDVYDALTAERVYHKAMSPAEALRKLHEWSRFHFNEELVTHFIRNLGIYPVRTVVRMESGMVGIVVDQNPDELLRPVVLVVCDTDAHRVSSPYRLDLRSAAACDRIVAHEPAEKYRLDVDRCLAAA